MFRVSSLQLIIVVVFFSVGYLGCGGSQEAAAEDELVTDTGTAEETPVEDEQQTEQPAEEQPAQEQPQQQQAQEEQPQEQPASQEGPTKEQLQSDLDALKTENMQLRDENNSLQMTNKNLTNKISDLEAANAALSASPKRSEPVKYVRRAASPGSSSPEEIQAYEQAVGKANGRNYREAISDLQRLLTNGIKDDFADNCQYWIGECNFQLKDYSQAIQHFQRVQGYKYSEKMDDAQFMIARSYEMLADRSKAQSEYKRLVDLYPTSEYVRRARAKLR